MTRGVNQDDYSYTTGDADDDAVVVGADVVDGRCHLSKPTFMLTKENTVGCENVTNIYNDDQCKSAYKDSRDVKTIRTSSKRYE